MDLRRGAGLCARVPGRALHSGPRGRGCAGRVGPLARAASRSSARGGRGGSPHTREERHVSVEPDERRQDESSRFEGSNEEVATQMLLGARRLLIYGLVVVVILVAL